MGPADVVILGICALVVAAVAAGLSGWSVLYTRKATIAAENSSVAAAITARLDADRRHAELAPQFRITCHPANQGVDALRLTIYLVGPAELERLDGLTVVIRDDHPWRAQGTPSAAGPTPEDVAAQIWGRWRFIPHTGPGAGTLLGGPGADSTGRTSPTSGMPVGEELPFFLEPTSSPQWSQQPLDAWQQEMKPYLRLRLECHRDGQRPWILPCEMVLTDGVGFVEVPKSLST